MHDTRETDVKTWLESLPGDAVLKRNRHGEIDYQYARHVLEFEMWFGAALSIADDDAALRWVEGNYRNMHEATFWQHPGGTLTERIESNKAHMARFRLPPGVPERVFQAQALARRIRKIAA